MSIAEPSTPRNYTYYEPEVEVGETRNTLMWDLNRDDNVARMGDLMRQHAGMAWDPEHPYDEVALLATSNRQAFAAVQSFVRRGWRYFNNAEDTVTTHPFRTQYDVTYHFLAHQNVGWRIELMTLGYGLSPVHWAILDRTRSGALPVVHLSFKVPNMSAYEAVLSRWHGHLLHAQSCTSSYGVFSYWAGQPVDGNPEVYLKPRINLRDTREGNGR